MVACVKQEQHTPSGCNSIQREYDLVFTHAVLVRSLSTTKTFSAERTRMEKDHQKTQSFRQQARTVIVRTITRHYDTILVVVVFLSTIGSMRELLNNISIAYVVTAALNELKMQHDVRVEYKTRLAQERMRTARLKEDQNAAAKQVTARLMAKIMASKTKMY